MKGKYDGRMKKKNQKRTNVTIADMSTKTSIHSHQTQHRLDVRKLEQINIQEHLDATKKQYSRSLD